MKVQFKLLLLALALALICCFALVACDDDEPAPASSSSSSAGGSSTGGSSSSSIDPNTLHEVSFAYKDASGNDVVVHTARVRHGGKVSPPDGETLERKPDMVGKAFVQWILPDDVSALTDVTVLAPTTIYFEARDLEVFDVSVAIPAAYADYYTAKYPDAKKDADGNLVILTYEVFERGTFNTNDKLPLNLPINEYTYYDTAANEWKGFYFNYAWETDDELYNVSSDILFLADINEVEGMVPYVDNAPTIDGVRDAAYGKATYKLVKSWITGSLPDSVPDYDWEYLDATYSLCWSGEYIYVFVEVKDPSLNMSYDSTYADYVRTQDNPWLNDAVEMWFSLGQLRSGVTYDEATNTYTDANGVVCENANQYLFSKQCVDAQGTKLYCGMGAGERTPTYFPAIRDNADLRAATRKLNDGEQEGGKGVYTVEFVIRARHDATEAEKVETNLDPLNKDVTNKVYLGKKLDAGNLVFFGLQISDAYRTQGAQDRAKFLAFGTQSSSENAGAYKATVRNEKYAIVPGTPVGALEGDGYQIYRMVLGGAAPKAN